MFFIFAILIHMTIKLNMSMNVTNTTTVATADATTFTYINQKQGNYTAGPLKSNLTVLWTNFYLFLLIRFTCFLMIKVRIPLAINRV